MRGGGEGKGCREGTYGSEGNGMLCEKGEEWRVIEEKGKKGYGM